MAIGANSYGSVPEVVALVRHLMDGGQSFGTNSRPTLLEVEAIVNRVSGVLNTAIAGAGFTVPISQATAKLACDDWVVARVVAWVELTQRGEGFLEGEGSRHGAFLNLHADAAEFVAQMSSGWKNLGVTVSDGMYQGLTFTAFDKHGERSDPDSSTLEQPKFRRGQFDN